MRLNTDINFVVGNKENFTQIESCKPLKIFSDSACNFLNSLSKKLLADSRAKNFSDVITFAFWCRKASIKKMAADYEQENFRFGRGILFHIAPSNVAVNFAYSFAAGLLAGNVNIVRLPSKNFEQVEIICDAIKKILSEDFSEMIPYVYMIRYGHEKNITDLLSSICDVRIIWGGDETIKTIRQSPLKVRANEITFSDRYGIAVINSDEYLKAENKNKIAADFFNDTYLTDQNACSSPKIIFWLGENTDEARKIFWETLQKIVDKNYNLADVKAVEKLTKLYLLGNFIKTKFIKSADNKITRAEIFEINSNVANFQGNCGFFIEHVAKNLSDILPVCEERCQTLTYFGFEKNFFAEFINLNRPKGIDRIVPIGKTLDFSLTWDGYDLIRSMSKIFHIENFII